MSLLPYSYGICILCKQNCLQGFYVSSLNTLGRLCSLECLDQFNKSKEQQMTRKFKIGDRVKYNSGSWEGSTGTITVVRQHAQYHVVFDKGTTAYAYKSTAHNTDEFELELIPMQDKVLIKPEDYHTLKKDDEVEITVIGFLLDDKASNYGFSVRANSSEAFIHAQGAGFNPNMETTVYKLTPKATKLEVGDVLYCSNDLSKKTVTIDDISTYHSEVFMKYEDKSVYRVKRSDKHSMLYWVRKSGIPIDWEATFS